MSLRVMFCYCPFVCRSCSSHLVFSSILFYVQNPVRASVEQLTISFRCFLQFDRWWTQGAPLAHT